MNFLKDLLKKPVIDRDKKYTNKLDVYTGNSVPGARDCHVSVTCSVGYSLRNILNNNIKTALQTYKEKLVDNNIVNKIEKLGNITQFNDILKEIKTYTKIVEDARKLFEKSLSNKINIKDKNLTCRVVVKNSVDSDGNSQEFFTGEIIELRPIDDELVIDVTVYINKKGTLEKQTIKNEIMKLSNLCIDDKDGDKPCDLQTQQGGKKKKRQHGGNITNDSSDNICE